MSDTRDDKMMPIMGHLRELRNVLIKCAIALAITTAIAFAFTTPILQFLIAPYGSILETIDPTENVTTYFRVALASGAVLAMPFLVYFIWTFIAPGLEEKEKRYVRFIVPGATILFLIGVAFAWGIMLPAAILSSEFEPDIFKTSWRASAYIPFVTSLMFWIGVAFELPLIVFFLAKLKIVTAKQAVGLVALCHRRRGHGGRADHAHGRSVQHGVGHGAVRVAVFPEHLHGEAGALAAGPERAYQMPMTRRLLRASRMILGCPTFMLPNGLRVWIEPRPDSESVTALLVVRVGSRYETPANNGISHFVEHLVFDGTEKWPTEEAVADAITHRGGNWNGWTDEETTTYFVQLAQHDFDLALDWLSQVVFHPTFPADKVNKERDIIFEEKMGRYGWLLNALDALGLGYDLDRDVRRALFPGSTLGLRIIGEDASLDKITRQSLLDYYHTHYLPTNSALIIVGNVDVEHARERP